jgi:hypothetical protein
MKYQCAIEIQQRPNQSTIKCPICKRNNSLIGDLERQEIICRNCGTVVSEDTSNVFDYYASNSIQLVPPVPAPYTLSLSINRNQN